MANDTILLETAVEEDLNIGVGRVEVSAPSGGSVVGHRINISSFGIAVRFTADFGTLAPSQFASVNVTVNGAVRGYPVLVAFESSIGLTQIAIESRVIDLNTVNIALINRQDNQSATVGSVTGTVIVFPIPGADSA